MPRVLGDERLLGQVVLNLVMNALQAIPEGTPETNAVSVSTRCEGAGVRLVVDCGVSITIILSQQSYRKHRILVGDTLDFTIPPEAIQLLNADS